MLAVVAPRLASAWALDAPDETTRSDVVAGWNRALSVRECQTPPLMLPADAEVALTATLLVRTERGVGSAVLISPDGFALTAAHVVGDEDFVTAITRDGQRVKVAVVRVSERDDVALLKLNGTDASPCLRPVGYDQPLGADVFVLGSPAGEELSFSIAKGIVAAYRDFEGTRFVQLDASINPGNSGGPAVNEAGEIVGLASWKVSHVAMEGLAFAVPIDAALSSLAIELGPTSATDWASSPVRLTADTPAVTSTAPSDASREVAARSARRQRLTRSLIVGGAVTLGTGALLVAGTGIPFLVSRSRTRDGTGDGIEQTPWKVLVAFNTVGWATSGIGAGALVAGIVLRMRSRPARVDVAVAPSPGGVTVRGKF